MKFQLEIELENDAFYIRDKWSTRELERLLRRVARAAGDYDVEQACAAGAHEILRDINGNTVGHFIFKM
jgi:hypothetical protein